jgi:hypothetical protein
VFNGDGRFYSQAFMNPYEGLETEEKLVCGHETRVRETTEIPSDNIVRFVLLSCCLSRRTRTRTVSSVVCNIVITLR